jgi:hypothetical protein
VESDAERLARGFEVDQFLADTARCIRTFDEGQLRGGARPSALVRSSTRSSVSL